MGGSEDWAGNAGGKIGADVLLHEIAVCC